jgi:acyl dehydratase
VSDELVAEWLGTELENPLGDIACEPGFIHHWLEATENANPLFWEDEVAGRIAGGPLAPPTMLSVWMRPLVWKPGAGEPVRPLELHFRMKEAFGLPDGIVYRNEIAFHQPVRPGDRVRTTESVREIGELRESRVGTGRNWTIDVTYRNQRDEVVGVETYEMFSYVREGASS